MRHSSGMAARSPFLHAAIDVCGGALFSTSPTDSYSMRKVNAWPLTSGGTAPFSRALSRRGTAGLFSLAPLDHAATSPPTSARAAVARMPRRPQIRWFRSSETATRLPVAHGGPITSARARCRRRLPGRLRWPAGAQPYSSSLPFVFYLVSSPPLGIMQMGAAGRQLSTAANMTVLKE
jgi:hypothetical protein